MTTLDARTLIEAASAAAGAQQYPAPALYVVATPIGNLADLSLRALHVLGLVDAVACEDTRVGAVLLRAFGLAKPLVALHAHNEHGAAQAVLARLAAGERVALISDAGTPAVSDPGAALVAAVRAAGHRSIPLPGPSSALAALSVAGDTARGGFVFVGFLPARGGDRAEALRRLAEWAGTQVLFEAPHRIETLAAELAAALADRPLTIARELTKQFETVATMPAADLPGWLAVDANRLRGEFVLVLHGRAAAEAADEAGAHDHLLSTLLGVLPLKQAVAVAVELSGAPRNALYARALELKG